MTRKRLALSLARMAGELPTALLKLAQAYRAHGANDLIGSEILEAAGIVRRAIEEGLSNIPSDAVVSSIADECSYPDEVLLRARSTIEAQEAEQAALAREEASEMAAWGEPDEEDTDSWCPPRQ